MKRLAVAAVLAMCLAGFLAANLLAAPDAAPVPAAKSPTAAPASEKAPAAASEKAPPAEKAPAAANLPTIEKLIGLAAETTKGAKDVTADFKTTQHEVTFTGTVKAIGGEYVKMYADHKDKDAGGAEKVTGVVQAMLTPKMMYLEMSGKGAEGPQDGAIQFDPAELQKIQQELGMEMIKPSELTPPDFGNYLKSEIALRGWQAKVVKAEGGKATVELLRETKEMTMGGPQTVKKLEVDEVSLKDGMVTLIKSYKDGKLTSTDEYSNYKFNVGLKPTDFVFKASEGVKVTDLTAQLRQALEAKKQMQMQQPKNPAPNGDKL